MSKHTPEPWAVIDRLTIQGPRVAGDPLKCGLLVASLPHWCEPGDARRIVACVNACKGVSTEDLESAPGYKAAIDGFHEQRALVVEVRNQRDELDRQLEESIALGVETVEVRVSDVEIAQQVADLENELEVQRSLNGRLNSENEALSARVLARVEELQFAVQARLAAEEGRDDLLAALKKAETCLAGVELTDYPVTDDLAAVRAAIANSKGGAA